MISNCLRRVRVVALLSSAPMALACAADVRRQHDALVTAIDASASPRAPEELAPSTSDRWTRAEFVREVLDRNPSLAAAREAWRAATAEIPQQLAIDDPMIEYAFAPLSIGASEVDFGQSITVRQSLPWPGVRGRSGRRAVADARAAEAELAAERIDLALAACLLFDDYFLVHRELEVLAHHDAIAREIGEVALAQYESGQEAMQSPIRAEIETALLERQRLELQSRRAVLAAQMNVLLHRSPRAPLPPPPPELKVLPAPTDDDAAALDRRPELAAARARSHAGTEAIRVAQGDFFPRFDLMTQYSTMWPMLQHRWMVGVGINVPLSIGARRAAVAQARAEQARRVHILEAQTIEVRAELEQARTRAQEADAVLALYGERLLPAARHRSEVVQAAYSTGTASLESVLDAERMLREVELARETAIADVDRRRAELWRALGRLPEELEGGDEP